MTRLMIKLFANYGNFRKVQGHHKIVNTTGKAQDLSKVGRTLQLQSESCYSTKRVSFTKTIILFKASNKCNDGAVKCKNKNRCQ